MIRIWPSGATPDGDRRDLDDAGLVESYAYPADLTVPWVRVNFVASIDGAAAVDGVSGGLGTAADKTVFGVLRELADVVLVGSGTVRAENYRGARTPTRGRTAPPPIAVVTGSAGLDPESALFTDTVTPPIILTTADAPADRRERLAAAGGDVAVLDDLTPELLLAELGRRGLLRVLCEGGPSLHGQLLAADAVDELCLTISPLAAGGDAGRIAHGPPGAEAQRLELATVLFDDSTLLLRYRRQEQDDGPNE